MKKFGFTLAEILIALAVVGIVAAISIPGLVTENKKKVWANSLSVAVSDFENAIATYIMTEGGTCLTDLDVFMNESDFDSFMEHFSEKRMQLNKKANSPDNYYASPNFIKPLNPKMKANASIDVNGSIPIKKASVWENKKGTMYLITDKHTDMAYSVNKNIPLQMGVAIVMIDVNGKKIPNRLGRDIFFYILSNDGYLFPLAGEEHKEYLKAMDKSITDLNALTNCVTNSNNALSGMYCSAILTQNGYKMDY